MQMANHLSQQTTTRISTVWHTRVSQHQAEPLAGLASASAANAPLPHPAVWKANQFAQAHLPTISSGYQAIDKELPGEGWPASTFIEILARAPGIGELRFLTPLLRQLSQQKRPIILLAPPHHPNGPALVELGIDPNLVLIVDAKQAADRLWAVEQSMRSEGFGALLSWLPGDGKTRPEHLRRMQMAAQNTQGLVFAFRPLSAAKEASPAALRIALMPRPHPHLAVHILKRRGPLMLAPIEVTLPVSLSALSIRPQALAKPKSVRRLIGKPTHDPAQAGPLVPILIPGLTEQQRQTLSQRQQTQSSQPTATLTPTASSMTASATIAATSSRADGDHASPSPRSPGSTHPLTLLRRLTHHAVDRLLAAALAAGNLGTNRLRSVA